MEARPSSERGRLLRLGFVDPERAEEILQSRLIEWQESAEILTQSADPDQALMLLDRISESSAEGRDLIRQAAADELLAQRLVLLLGVSMALGEHLARHPGHVDILRQPEIDIPSNSTMRRELLLAVGADPGSPDPVATQADALVAMRVGYRRLLVHIAMADLLGASLEQVGEALADAADAVLASALAVARAQTPGHEQCRLSVIALGKSGARELNYISDVDVVFVAEPAQDVAEDIALAVGTRLASTMMTACSASTAEGSIWEVDANLRPEGRNGALVRTLASHVTYYQRFASTWEFQALLKARPAAGDGALGRAYADAVAPLVWAAADRSDFVDNARAMRRKVETNIPAREAAREIKLGVGGLRDVEFSVQLLQLVHGRSDVMLRRPDTLTALENLATWGYVGRGDAAALSSAYRFMRTLEHRIQLHRLRRTHLMPEEPQALRRLGRAMGFTAEPADALMSAFRQTQLETRRIHEKLYYRPLLDAVSRLDAGDARLTPDAARERLEALGYRDPQGALRHLEALTSGVSRRAAIQRTLLPVLLGWFAESPEPDAGLLAFRQVSDALGSTHWYLRLLRDESLTAERLARVLASSRYATDLLLRAPEAVALLADDTELEPRSQSALEAEMRTTAARHEDPTAAVTAIRAIRRRELFRIAAADMLGLADVEHVVAGLSAVTGATITAALDAVMRSVEQQRGSLPLRFSVIAMGRLGGGELSYGSDADVMFVHDPLPGASEQDVTEIAFQIAHDLRTLLMTPSADPPVNIDADLRPEGTKGPLVRSLASFAAYYQRWSASWESQALLRAEVLAGDASLGREFLDLVEPLRWPTGGLPEATVREIRRLKARMENERLPRGADPALHTKLGRGGLSDVEWVAQLLQMQHAHQFDQLRTNRTLEALRSAASVGLLAQNDAQVLADAWSLATRMRNAMTLVTGKSMDSLPTGIREISAIAGVLGHPSGHGQDVLEEYRRATRRARVVVERVFYGLEVTPD
jgi:[glutamine synthetase] adenylyltransferase / [glutamine synthetase]-adenylyl-L-tyrosine phosphorylase